MKLLIKSRKDAQEFVSRIREYALPDPYDPEVRVFWFCGDRYIDPCLNRPTRTTVRIYPDGTWFWKSSGPGWEDQAWEEIVDPARWVYAHRAGINRKEEKL